MIGTATLSFWREKKAWRVAEPVVSSVPPVSAFPRVKR